MIIESFLDFNWLFSNRMLAPGYNRNVRSTDVLTVLPAQGRKYHPPASRVVVAPED